MTRSLRSNVIANFVGRGWSAALNLALLPLYGKLLGMDAVGLLGVNTLLSQIFNLLDMGLSPTLARETARLTSVGLVPVTGTVTEASYRNNCASELRHLVRTVEIVYWPIALIIVMIVSILAWPLAHHWIPASRSIQPSSVTTALLLMGISIAVQWPYTLYEGALMGLHRQVLLNIIVSICSTVRGIGALVVIHFYPTIIAFFVWQAFAYCLLTAGVALAVWMCLPTSDQKPKFDLQIVRGIGKYAAGMTGVTALGFLLTQMDKFVLSRQLTLHNYAYYTLAFSAAGGLYFIIAPLYSAYFPHFVQLHTRQDTVGFTKLFHQAGQAAAAAILPATMIMIMAPKEIISVWTQNSESVLHTYQLFRLFALGFGLFSLMHVSLAALLASNMTAVVFRHNLISVLLGFPLLIWATRHYGAIGAVVVWIIVNIGYMAVMAPGAVRKLMPSETIEWLKNDILIPVLASAFVAMLCRRILDLIHVDSFNRALLAVALVVAWALTSMGCLMSLGHVRGMLRGRLAPN